MAVEQYALHGDAEGDAVREHAGREEEAAAEQDLALEDPSLFADLEEEAQPEGPPEAIPVAQPDSPTEHERELHRLTHLPFPPWSEFCTSGKARQAPFIDVTNPLRRTEWNGPKEEEVEDESRLVTILCLTDTTTGWPMALQLPNKSREVSQSKYVLRNIDRTTRSFCNKMANLQSEPWEIASNATLELPRSQRGSHRPSCSKAMNGFVASQIIALWMDVRTQYPELDASCNLTPWLVHHAAWFMARYQTKSRDGLTPYRMVNGADYNDPLATLGEIMLGKIPMPKGRKVCGYESWTETTAM